MVFFRVFEAFLKKHFSYECDSLSFRGYKTKEEGEKTRKKLLENASEVSRDVVPRGTTNLTAQDIEKRRFSEFPI